MDLGTEYSDKPNEYYGEERNDIIAYIPKNVKRLLDIGCSSGEFGLNLKKHFPQICIWGIEPFEKAAQLANGKLDKVICSQFNANLAELQDQTFDCITFNDVLEHLVNPDQALKNCIPLLTNNGRIVASIPNVLFFPVMYNLIKNEDWKYEDSGVLDSTHLKFFTKKSIIRLFEGNGFKIVSIEGINVKVHDKFLLYKILNILFFNRLKNWKYMQFIVIAEKIK